MSECRDIESFFAVYVDGLAQPADCAAVDAHISLCPACRNRVASERAAREALVARRESLRVCASADLKRRCEASTAAEVATRAKAVPRRAWVPLSMAATLVLAVAGVFIYGLQGGSEALAAQLAVDHVKCFEFAPQPTIMPDPASLSREWASQRGWSIKIPENAPVQQLELLTMRRCISTEGLTAHIMYKWRGQPLSVYVLNSEHPRVGPVPKLVERLGQEAIMWSKGGRTYAVVARGRPSDIEQVAHYVRTAAE
jgi:anti-sigma factor RsiW